MENSTKVLQLEINRCVYIDPRKGCKEELQRISRNIIIEALFIHNGDIKNTGISLGIKRTTLFERMKVLEITRDSSLEEIVILEGPCQHVYWINLSHGLKPELERIEVDMIQKYLLKNNGTVSYVARNLGIKRSTLSDKMTKYGLSADDYT